MHCTYCHSSQPYPHTRKLRCPNHPECFLCRQSHCSCVCKHNPHSEAALQLKAEEEARVCAERHAAKLTARQARRQQARQQREATKALGEKILDATRAEASGHSIVSIEQGAGKGLVSSMSELAGDDSVLTLTSFVTGCVQVVEAAE